MTHRPWDLVKQVGLLSILSYLSPLPPHFILCGCRRHYATKVGPGPLYPLAIFPIPHTLYLKSQTSFPSPQPHPRSLAHILTTPPLSLPSPSPLPPLSLPPLPPLSPSPLSLPFSLPQARHGKPS